MKGLELLNDEIRGGDISEARAQDEMFRNTSSTIPDSNILPDAPLSPATSLSSGASLARPPRPRIQKIFVRESERGRAEEVTTADDEILIRHWAPNIPDSSFNQRGGGWNIALPCRCRWRRRWRGEYLSG